MYIVAFIIALCIDLFSCKAASLFTINLLTYLFMVPAAHRYHTVRQFVGRCCGWDEERERERRPSRRASDGHQPRSTLHHILALSFTPHIGFPLSPSVLAHPTPLSIYAIHVRQHSFCCRRAFVFFAVTCATLRLRIDHNGRSNANVSSGDI